MSQTRAAIVLLAALGSVLGAAVLTGCGSGHSSSAPDTQALRAFTDFPVYWLGDRFERWALTSASAPSGSAEFVTLVYGDCTPHGGDHPSCTPPIAVQVFPLCAHLRETTRAPVWRHRRIRGAPVGTIDDAPVLFSRRSQVKVYRGEGADRGADLRALHALRSLNRVAPVIGPIGAIPAPAAGVLAGTRPCPGAAAERGPALGPG